MLVGVRVEDVRVDVDATFTPTFSLDTPAACGLGTS